MIETIALFFNKGGVFIWFLLGVLAIATAVVIERMIFYFITCRKRGGVLYVAMADAVNKNDLPAAIAIAEQNSAPVNIMAKSALVAAAASKNAEEIVEAVEQSSIIQMPRMTQRLNYLSLFANIATLMGLLGTVAGLQQSFGSLAAVEASKKAAMLAGGIAEAMNMTAFGLVVAIPCMIMYTVLHNKQAQITREIDDTLVRLLSLLKKRAR